ncbi:Benzoate 4-monooxygenase [Leucoagaricus sp. SymC.cos]|nr:Benzoate 4-monooxygenase [Leucoagaricus sp. SymC.cos]
MTIDAIQRLVTNAGPQTAVLATAMLLYRVVPCLLDPKGIRKYPGHIVRIAPNHISVASSDVINVIYGHGNDTLKSDFYDDFVSIERGLFKVRDMSGHTRKRKIFYHIFSQKNVIAFELKIYMYIEQFLDQWNLLYDMSVKGSLVMMVRVDEKASTEGSTSTHWNLYLVFNLVGDLVFGEQAFGMLAAAQDMHFMTSSYEKEVKQDNAISVPVVNLFNSRGELNSTLTAIPHRRPLARRPPAQGSRDVKTVTGIFAAFSKRFVAPTDRVDLLNKLQSSRDANDKPMDGDELTAEALTLLIAAPLVPSSTTSSLTADKLHKELDEQLNIEDELVAISEQIKRLSYLVACINEGLRIYSTSDIGFPRAVPEGSLEHRDPEIWGDDCEVYRPERWFERDQAAMHRAFDPYSVGPCVCVSRTNVAAMELSMIIAFITRHFDFEFEYPAKSPNTSHQDSRRSPAGARLGIKRKDV